MTLKGSFAASCHSCVLDSQRSRLIRCLSGHGPLFVCWPGSELENSHRSGELQVGRLTRRVLPNLTSVDVDIRFECSCWSISQLPLLDKRLRGFDELVLDGLWPRKRLTGADAGMSAWENCCAYTNIYMYIYIYIYIYILATPPPSDLPFLGLFRLF